MACTFSLSPPAIYVGRLGTSDRNIASPTPPIQVALNVQGGCGWEPIQFSGSFWSMSGAGSANDGSATLTFSIDPNPNFQARTDNVIILPFANEAPALFLPIIQTGLGPPYPGLINYIWNPLWWLNNPPGPPFNPGIAINSDNEQIILARLISELASQLTDLAAMQQIQKLTQNVSNTQWTRLKNKPAKS